MEQQNKLSDEALKVLGVLRDRSMDGYTLQSETSLTKEILSQSLKELIEQALVNVNGAITIDRIGESFFSVPVDAVGDADSTLGRFTRAYRR